MWTCVHVLPTGEDKGDEKNHQHVKFPPKQTSLSVFPGTRPWQQQTSTRESIDILDFPPDWSFSLPGTRRRPWHSHHLLQRNTTLSSPWWSITSLCNPTMMQIFEIWILSPSSTWPTRAWPSSPWRRRGRGPRSRCFHCCRDNLPWRIVYLLINQIQYRIFTTKWPNCS